MLGRVGRWLGFYGNAMSWSVDIFDERLVIYLEIWELRRDDPQRAEGWCGGQK